MKSTLGQPSDATKYKTYFRKFKEGIPHEWIDILRDSDEIWTQNSSKSRTDRVSTMRALVHE
jgi:hypothetical protein